MRVGLKTRNNCLSPGSCRVGAPHAQVYSFHLPFLWQHRLDFIVLSGQYHPPLNHSSFQISKNVLTEILGDPLDIGGEMPCWLQINLFFVMLAFLLQKGHKR